MPIDEQLKTDFRSLPRKVRESLQAMWDAYEVASGLSSGKDPSRSDHWTEIARNRWAKLRNRVNGEMAHSEPTANPIAKTPATAEPVENLP